MCSATQTSYDDVPYESHPYPQTHPDRLATQAWLLGVAAAPLDRCRVLEIGCAAGGNLIPMAADLPQAEFVGIDLSAVQVAQGVAEVAALGLSNIRLLKRDLADDAEELGTFDYIIAHGVYSWVPNDVQKKLLDHCSSRLAPEGIAYVSYNTLPGWRMRGVVREAMHYHAGAIADAPARVAQARAILNFLAESVPGDGGAYSSLLRSELELLRKQGDHYILHEHLEEVNEPLYFHQFVARAAHHGLQYLAEADFGTMFASNFAPQVAETLVRIAPDLVRQEQYMDFLRNRTFRQTLLVHDKVALTRNVAPQRVEGLSVASPAQPLGNRPDLHSDAAAQFSTPGGSCLTTSNRITKAAMVVLAERWPATLAFDDLIAAARSRLRGRSEVAQAERDTLAADMLQCYAAGVVELRVRPLTLALKAGERPLASRLARHQAGRRAVVTNLRHETVTLDAAARQVLALLDGKHTLSALLPVLRRHAGTGLTANQLKLSIDGLARLALLVR